MDRASRVHGPASSSGVVERAPADGATVARVVPAAAERYAATALRYPQAGGFVEMSYGELGRTARDIARGLLALGVKPQDRVSILANTRAEWTLADFGSFCAGAVVAPIDHTNSPEECAYVLGHAESRVVFCEDAEQLSKVEQVRSRCPSLEHVVLLDGDAEGALSLRGLRERSSAVAEDELDARVGAIDPDDVATLVHTSGTTGPPKGCMITHRNFLATTDMYRERLELGDDRPVIFMFLPLAHALARVAQTVTIDVGGTLAFWGGDPRRIIGELAEARPSHFPAVPRIYEKVHAAVMVGSEGQGRIKRELFEWAVARGRRVRELQRRGATVGPLLRAEHAIADRLVLSKVRDLFGGRLELALVGAAPISREILEFFDACGVLILEGYGMTESCAAATLNSPSELRFGTVGRALPGTEVAIAEDGEVLMRGPNIFRGYFKDPEATEQTLQDGWLHSGDLGALTSDGYLQITGRKKDLIITSSGKNITPTNIENMLRESRWIAEAVVYGDRRPYLVAMVTLETDELPALAEQFGISPDLAAMAAEARVRAAIQSEIDDINARLARIEQVKRFAILDHDLTQAAGELTPTLKVKRAVVYERYADTFDALYAG
jgi:long-chain acyl-CoA synthetase